MEKKVLKGRKKRRALSQYEQNVLLPILLKGLKTKVGKENAVTRTQMLNMLSEYKVMANRRSLERVIKYIRLNHLIYGLMATNYGYYIAKTEEELIAYERSLRGRERALRDIRRSINIQRSVRFTDKVPKHTQMF